MQNTEQREGFLAKDVMVSRSRKMNRRLISDVHYHEEYELYYMLDGGTTYFIGDEIYGVNKGDFVFIPQGIPHNTDNENYRYNERILISFSEELFDVKNQFVLEALKENRVIHVPENRKTELEELLFKIEAEYAQAGNAWKELLDLYIKELLVLIYRYRCDRRSVIRESDKIVYLVSAYISDNYQQELTLKGLSSVFSISEGYLSRKFKEVTGLGVKQYITYVRISHAEKLLRQSELSVTEIAEACGFCGSTYFSSVFRKIKGVVPTAYRKR